MLILFDHGTPRSIARWLKEHTVVEAFVRGWDRLSNGELLSAAEEAGFDVLLTTDKNIRYQQNLKDRRLAIVVLGNPQRPAVERHIERIVAAVNSATPGGYIESRYQTPDGALVRAPADLNDISFGTANVERIRRPSPSHRNTSDALRRSGQRTICSDEKMALGSEGQVKRERRVKALPPA